MDLGEIIRETRQKAFFTQEEFAQKIGVALSTVNRWELDKACPNVKAMKEIKSFCKENEMDYKIIEEKWLTALRRKNKG